MLLAYLLLATGLTISAVAIYYSVVGLAAIFAAAAIPIYIMGGALEVAKLVCASWLKANWERIPRLMKTYMTIAVVVLMFITSMGIFGFLSKAHLDSNLVSGDVVDKVAIIDEKIRTQKDNIEAARKALRQMDESVDQTMARSNDEKGADKAAALRRGQQRERTNLQNDIARAQKEIAALNEERAPIAKDLRKVEAEVGPIKYIAKLIYGDNPDANVLEKAVTWVIIIIVMVFDPLAVIMLLAAQMTFGWKKEEPEPSEPKTINDFVPQPQEYIPDPTEEVEEKVEEDKPFKGQGVAPAMPMIAPYFQSDSKEEIVPVEPVAEYKVVDDADEEVKEDNTGVTKNEYQDILSTEDAVLSALEEKPKKEISIIDNEYLVIDGTTYNYNSMGGNNPKIRNSVDLAKQLESTGEYVITHTAKGVIITDTKGNETEIPLEKTYVQNEEQKEGGLWQKIQHNISETEYINKSEQNQKGTS